MDFEIENKMQQEGQIENNGRIVSEDPSYHSIRIYNMVRDRMWEQLDRASNSTELNQLLPIISGLKLLLLRGDKIWLELKYAIKEQRSNLKITEGMFPYKNELEEQAIKIQDIINIVSNANLIATEGSPVEVEEAIEYIELNKNRKLSWIKMKIEKIILEADEEWGKGAARIHFTMPVDVKDTRDPFL